VKKSIVPRCLFALLLITGLCGCEKKAGEAVVIGKDYVAVAKQGEELNDERATNHEQWIVKVRMLDNSRTIQLRADRRQWETLRENDRVKVAYRTGKYTGTIWDAEIR
jgi:hypothetical protein